jgi:excisionase family DNA binding protein
LADLLVEAGETVRQVAEEAQDQLAVRAKRALMDDVTRTATNVPAPRRKLLTVTDIAGIVGCRPRTVRRWREEGRLPPALHFGGLVRWEETDVLAWLDTCKEAKR